MGDLEREKFTEGTGDGAQPANSDSEIPEWLKEVAQWNLRAIGPRGLDAINSRMLKQSAPPDKTGSYLEPPILTVPPSPYEIRARQEAEQRAKKEFPQNTELAKLAAQQITFNEYGYGQRLSVNDTLKLSWARAERQGRAEFPKNHYAAKLKMQEILYAKYGLGQRLDQAQSEYLLEIKAQMKAEAELNRYSGEDRSELVVLAQREILSREGFEKLRLSDQEKARLDEARAARDGKTYYFQNISGQSR